ncbi:Arylsulfotransferase-domain-containing protein [Xylariaceae sp. FL0255]|nr:Arylsulfotransferase-domain-containing protein [Xylariaceae sp. FL0255]
MQMRLPLSAILTGLCAGLAFAQSTTTSVAWPHQTFKSEPTFQPPVFKVTPGSGTPAPGYIVYAPAGIVPQPAPLITTNDNDLVWHGEIGEQTFALTVSQYRNESVLAYWTGTPYPEPVGRGYGYVVLLNNAYEVVANITLAGNFVTASGATFDSNIDLHEIFITNRGTVLVTANNVTQTDLTSVGGPSDGWVVDGQFYEIDIATNQVLFSWNSLNHTSSIPFSFSTYPLGSEGFDAKNKTDAWGYFHINAVAPYDDGYIISSRYTCSEYHISAQGDVVWRLGGVDGGDFVQGPNTSFCYQHDIRPVYSSLDSYAVPRNATLHLHDNANCPIDNGTVPSSGLVLNIDVDNMKVSLVNRYRNPLDPLYSTAQGSHQPLPAAGGKGNVFVGHGIIPYIEEFSHDGSIVQTIQFGVGYFDLSYRAFKYSWHGCPTTKPAVAVEAVSYDKSKLDLFVSWNGATDVTAWRVYAVADDGSSHLIAEAQKSGFETRVRVPNAAKMKVEAVLRKGSKCRQGKGAGISDIIHVN